MYIAAHFSAPTHAAIRTQSPQNHKKSDANKLCSAAPPRRLTQVFGKHLEGETKQEIRLMHTPGELN